MDKLSGNVCLIRNTYKSDARSEHARAVSKIDDLYGVQYGISMLMNARSELESFASDGQPLTDVSHLDEIAVWLEFILLRFEMHTESDGGDFGYQEYAAELSEDEKNQFLQARKLRRRHIQHLSPKWLRENTSVIDANDAVEGKDMRLIFGIEFKGPDGEITPNTVEVPPGQKVRFPFFLYSDMSDLALNHIDWMVFSSGVEKVIKCLQRVVRDLQAKIVAEINSLSRSEREEILLRR